MKRLLLMGSQPHFNQFAIQQWALWVLRGALLNRSGWGIRCRFILSVLVGFGLVSLGSCGVPANNPSPQVSPPSASPQTPVATSAKPSPNASAAAPRSPDSKPSSPVSKQPITVEKLKNAEYFLLAKGGIKLTNGTYEDPQTKRKFTLDDVVTYGDLNKDGIKDAVGSLKVTIPNSGNFSYLVAVVNDNGNPKNISAEFLGAQVKVKTITIKPDASMEVAIEQYRPGDPDCCPSIGLSRTYKLRSNQPASSPQATPQK
jgi:hypothetical protein